MAKKGATPELVQQHRAELAAEYREMVPKVQERIRQIILSERRNERGRLCDDLGTVQDYRQDAAYCHGTSLLMAGGADDPGQAEAAAAAAVRKGWTQEAPWDPDELQQVLAAQKEHEPIPEPIPEPDDAIKEFRAEPYLQALSQREAEVLILVKVNAMRPEQAAGIMGVTPGRARNLLSKALKRIHAVAEAEGWTEALFL